MSSKPPKKKLKKADFSKVESGSSTHKGRSARDREIDKRLAGAISDADMDKLRAKAVKKDSKKKDDKKAMQKKKNSEMQEARAKRKKTLKELRGG